MAATPETPATGVGFDSDSVKPHFNQYWYSSHTIHTILGEICHHATRCAFLSTPSLFFQLGHGLVAEDDKEGAREVERQLKLREGSKLFEYDDQWASDPGFVSYDFREPESIPVQYIGAFDYVIADPPFITEDVWEAYLKTVRMLLKADGKVLLTTVLENHTMLEGHLNGPLFIAAFRPMVVNLTYQYVCFLNYEPTRLNVVNSELPPEDPKLLAAVQMANDLRSSEREFTAQMVHRNRHGEALLPTKAHLQDVHLDNATPSASGGINWEEVPIEQMHWGHIPEGLTVYANGNRDTPLEGVGDPEDYGPVYGVVSVLRVMVSQFKDGIDQLQKLLDQQMKLRQKRMKLRKELSMLQEGADISEHAQRVEVAVRDVADTSREVDTSEAVRQELIRTLSDLCGDIEKKEAMLAEINQAQPADKQFPCHAQYESSMRECLEAYRTVEVKKAPLQELAADATRKYKSPLFNRMKELLQVMKDLKKASKAAPRE